MKKSNYTVIVGNVGTMPYTSKKLALECFNSYVSISKSGTTRAAGESVTLMQNDNIIAEYIGEMDIDQLNEPTGQDPDGTTDLGLI